MVRGDVANETISLSHCALYLPEPGTNQVTLADRAKPKPGDYTERDGFMAACNLRIANGGRGYRKYVRGSDFETGECFVEAINAKGEKIARRVAAIRGANVIAVKIDDDSGRVPQFALTEIDPAGGNDIQAFRKGVRRIVSEPDYYRCEYANTNPWNPYAGYEVVLKVKSKSEKGKSAVTHWEAFVAIEPYVGTGRSGVRPLPSRERLVARVEAAAQKGYDALLKPSAAELKALMDRVSFSLEGPADAADIVRRFQAGRYNIFSSTGGAHVPNLQGLWAGTWSAPWKASFTVNGNLPCAISFFDKGDTPELNEVLLKWLEARLPAMRENARKNFHARGFRAAAQTTVSGAETDFNPQYPHLYWHGGAPWLLSRLYDGYRHTLDKAWLRRIYPLMKEVAEYYEDVLVELPDGHLGFNPSYSPENWPTGKRPTSVNATMDNAIAREFLGEFIAATKILYPNADTRRSSLILQRLAPYAVSPDGFFAEWLAPDQPDNNEHRHASHLYALYDNAPAEIVTNAAFVAAIRKTIDARMDFNEHRSKTMAFGYVQNGLAASPSSRDPMHDRLPPCAYLAKALTENVNTVDSLMYWTFTDIFEEKGGGSEIFHGSFGLLNFQGIPKPTYNLFRMMNALGDEMLCNADPVFVTRERKTGKIAALVYAYPKSYEGHVPAQGDTRKVKGGGEVEAWETASPTDVDLVLEKLPAGAALEIETLDFEHGNAYAAWEAMGRPHSPTRGQIAALKLAGAATQREIVRVGKDGRYIFNRTLAPWTIVLLRTL